MAIGLKFPSSFGSVLPEDLDFGWGEDQPEGTQNLRTINDLYGRDKHIPTVSCFIGRRGKGKTLMTTTLGRLMQERFNRAGIPFRVYSNYWTSFSDRADQAIVEDLQEFPAWLDEVPYSLLLIDEVAELLPSMRPTTGNNLLTMTFFKQIRKRGVSIIMATQFPQEITTGILRQCDFFINCRALYGGRAVETMWWDWPGNITGNWGRKYWPPEPDTEDWKIVFHNTDKMWGSYNTDEIVAPHHSDRREAIRDQQVQRRGELVGASPEETLLTSSGEGPSFPPDLQKIFLDAQGSASGVVFLSDVLQPLRFHFGSPRAGEQQLAGRLRFFGYKVTQDGGDFFVTLP